MTVVLQQVTFDWQCMTSYQCSIVNLGLQAEPLSSYKLLNFLRSSSSIEEEEEEEEQKQEVQEQKQRRGISIEPLSPCEVATKFAAVTRIAARLYNVQSTDRRWF